MPEHQAIQKRREISGNVKQVGHAVFGPPNRQEDT
jgi:hypothetical protein